MSDNFQQVVEYLNERTPQARLERHKAFWGDNPAPEVAALIQAVERMLIDGKAELKALHLLKDLDHRQTVHMWDRDPDTVEGEKYRNAQSERGKRSAEKRKNSVPVEREMLNSLVEKLAKRRDALGDYIPPSELWEPLFGEMDAEGLSPCLSINKGAYTYSAGAEYTFDAFKSQVQRIRKKHKK